MLAVIVGGRVVLDGVGDCCIVVVWCLWRVVLVIVGWSCGVCS